VAKSILGPEKTKSIVITGGPGSGKTTVLEYLGAELSSSVFLVKEASTYLTNSLPAGVEFRRDERIAFQTIIYYWQKTREDSARLQAEGTPIVCDRGTLDGATYWPNGPEQFYERIGTSRERELSRYSAVIHLEVANREDYEKYLFTNSCRHEPWEQAKRLCDQAKALWSGHAHFYTVKSQNDFSLKQKEVRDLVSRLLAQKS
jgi:predicted ATPase